MRVAGIASRLRHHGSKVVAEPEGFLIQDNGEGPLKTGEPDRARAWGRRAGPYGPRQGIQPAHRTCPRLAGADTDPDRRQALVRTTSCWVARVIAT